jgi:hypothetical protein
MIIEGGSVDGDEVLMHEDLNAVVLYRVVEKVTAHVSLRGRG